MLLSDEYGGFTYDLVSVYLCKSDTLDCEDERSNYRLTLDGDK